MKTLDLQKLLILGYAISGSASFNSPNANLMQNKRVVRGNTYAQRVPIRSFNVSSTLEDRDFHGTPGTPGLMQRKFHQRNQILPNLVNGDIQVNTGTFFSQEQVSWNIDTMLLPCQMTLISTLSYSADRMEAWDQCN